MIPMKRFAMLAGIALAVGFGSAAMACENGIYAADEPTMTAPQQACSTGNCAVSEPTVQSADSRCPSNGCPVRPEPEPTVSTPRQPDPAAKPRFQLACGSGRSCGCCW
jgi:hypothetical protein